MANKEWLDARDELVLEMRSLGFKKELGELIAANLGSPKAIRRMTVYLQNVKPESEEMVVDEMLSICEEIKAWRDKKASLQANEKYNEMLMYNISDTDHED